MKYKYKDTENKEQEIELEPNDCLLTQAIDNLTQQIRRLVSKQK